MLSLEAAVPDDGFKSRLVVSYTRWVDQTQLVWLLACNIVCQLAIFATTAGAALWLACASVVGVLVPCTIISIPVGLLLFQWTSPGKFAVHAIGQTIQSRIDDWTDTCHATCEHLFANPVTPIYQGAFSLAWSIIVNMFFPLYLQAVGMVFVQHPLAATITFLAMLALAAIGQELMVVVRMVGSLVVKALSRLPDMLLDPELLQLVLITAMIVFICGQVPLVSATGAGATVTGVFLRQLLSTRWMRLWLWA